MSPQPVTLEGNGAIADGRLWALWYTATPQADGMAKYIAEALDGQQAGHMLPWVVRGVATGDVRKDGSVRDTVMYSIPR